MHAMENINEVHFDYKQQAWVINGRYVSCTHPESMNCKCYGKEHAGELEVGVKA